MKRKTRIAHLSILVLVALLGTLSPPSLHIQSVTYAQEALAAPTLVAEPTGATTIELSWTEVANAVSYELWAWWDDDTGWQRIGGDLAGTSYSHEDLKAGTTYYYQMRALAADGAEGAWSEQAQATPGAPAAPPLTATGGAGQITLTWEAVANAVNYELWAWWDDDTGWKRIGGDLTGTSYSHENLEAGTTYYYQMRALAADGAEGAWSEQAQATLEMEVEAPTPTPTPTEAEALPSPTLRAEPGAGQISLMWEAVANAVSYELWAWWDDDTDWQRIGGVLTGTSYSHENLEAGTAYYYQMRALAADGVEGAWSERVNATPEAQTEAPAAPTLIAEPGADQITLRWGAVANAISYELWAWWDYDTDWQPVGGVLTGTSYSHENLEAGTAYYYQMRALAADGVEGAWSERVNATPEAQTEAPAAPTLIAEPGADQITLRWGAVANAISYELWAWWDYDTDWQPVGGVLTGTSYTHENLTAGTTYSYQLRAVNGAGASPWSARLSVPTDAAIIPAATVTKTAAATANTAAVTKTAAATANTAAVTKTAAATANTAAVTKTAAATANTAAVTKTAAATANTAAVTTTTTVTTTITERDVLVALYRATGGANWVNKTNWLSNEPLSTWHGVTMSTSGHITGLNLATNKLSGTIPSDLLGKLTNLETIYLFGNQLRGTIPSDLGDLTNLVWLNLADNELTGSIPSDLGDLTSLAGLNLHGNELSGSIPSALDNLTNLVDLSLSGNQLSGCVPLVWENVETNDLTTLSLPFCPIDRAVLVALYRATGGASWWNKTNWLSDEPLNRWHGVTTDSSGRVTTLNLSGNQLRGTIPSELGKLTNLTYLSFYNNRLTGSIPSELGKLTKLTVLHLEINKLTGSIPSELGKLTNLTYLYLYSNRLTGSIPSELAKLTNLTRLHLSRGNKFAGCIPLDLRNVAENDLDSLDLPFCARDVLVALYRATGGASWRNKTNWLSAKPLNTWHGVKTDGSGRVTELDLSSNQLRGSIPSDLGYLTNLTFLVLGDNQLSGTIPSALGKLTNLTSLYLYSNELSGSIPSKLGNLTKLTTLSLFSNELDEAIPSKLGNLTNLTSLYLYSNELSGSIPSELGKLTNLTALYLAGNQLAGCVPGGWRYIASNDLDRLDLPFCDAGDREALVALYRATGGASWGTKTNWLSNEPLNTWHGVTTDESGRVIKLDLDKNQLSGSIPSDLGDLTNLTVLDLSYNQLSGSIPADLGNLTNLTWLDLNSNRLSGSIPSALGNLTNLKLLHLSINLLRGSIPSALGNLTKLTNLYLSGNELTGCVPLVWENVAINDLGKLSLPFCGVGDREALVALYRATGGASWGNKTNWLSAEPLDSWHGVTTDGSGRVTALDLSDNRLSGSIPSALGRLTNLTELNLSDNGLSGSIPSALGRLTKLTELNLSDNGLSGSIPSALDNLTNLTELNLSDNRLSGSIPSALGKLTKLTALHLSQNELSGCVPLVWENVETNDLDRLGLPFCARDVLVALYRATGGTNWGTKTNWLSAEPLNTWYGVTTDDSGGVIKLDLYDNRLRGSIPSALGNLTNLKVLYLGNNQLSGSIPSELGDLTNLTRLTLDNNQLSGAIPSALGDLTNLTRLTLYDNQLSGAIPSALGRLTNLTDLFLNDNQLSGAIPSELGNLTNLTRLTLDNNQLSGTIPSTLGKLTNLTDLSLNDNQLSGAIPSALGKLTNLTDLYLQVNQLSGAIPSALGRLTNLTDLFLNDNQLSGAIPSELGNLTNLTRLTLDNNQLSGTIPSALGKLTNLTDLYLQVNQLSGAIPSELGNLTKLPRLYLHDNQLSGTIPSALGNLTNLTALHLEYNQLSGAIPSELGNLTNLTRLFLNENKLSGSIPSALGKLTNLTYLPLSYNQLSGAIPSALGKLTNLTYLSLQGNQLSGAIPSELGKLTNLTYLYLYGGNELSGCVPLVLRNVASNDLANLGLPFCAPADRDVLVALYRATGGASWGTKTNWLSAKPLNTWHGVKTDGSGRVTELNLSSNQLRGSIPSDLGYLTNLTFLVLGDNQLSGTIPSALGKLTNLTSLYLYSNELSGSIPSKLGNLTKLTTLSLFSNELDEAIPSKLGNLTNLTSLYLYSNELSGSIPSALGKLTNLTALYLASNQLSGCVPLVLQNVAENDLADLGLPVCERDVLVALYRATGGASWGTKTNWLSDEPLNSWHGVSTDDSGRVTGLNLSDNQLKGSIPSDLVHLTNLTALNLSDNQLTGGIPSALGKLTSLTELYLAGGNKLSGCIPLVLRNVASNDLDSLGLPVCDRDVLVALYRATGGDNWVHKTNWLSDKALNTWHGVYTDDESGRVIALFLDNNQLTGSIPSDLGYFTKLTTLILNNNRLSGSIPSDLGNLTNLNRLRLQGNQWSGCIPLVLRNVATNDLADLGLPVCERDVLVALYRAAGGDNWGTKTNWLSGKPLSTWHGVTTDNSGRVTGLDLANNGLRGSIPSDLGHLANLTALAVYSNTLSGSIPSELGKLTNLTELYLNSNKLTGAIPSELGKLTNLTNLRLSGGNELTGCIPLVLRNVATNDLADLGLPVCARDVLVALYRATGGASWGNKTNWLSDEPLSTWYGVKTDGSGRVISLNLESNQLTGSIPSDLGYLGNLAVLVLSGNQLTGTIPSDLGKLTNLIALSLHSNKLTGSIPSELGKLTKLTELHLSGNKLSGCIPLVSRNVASNDLANLGLPVCDRDVLVAFYRATGGASWGTKTNWLSDEPLSTWHGVTTDGSGRVTGLALPGNRLTGSIPSDLGYLTNLTSLYLYSNQLSGSIPSDLGKLTNLTVLHLYSNKLTGAIPSDLGKLTNLTRLYLSGNQLRGSIPSALGNLTNLTRLWLNKNTLSGAIPSKLGNLTNLDWLRLSGNELTGCLPLVWKNVETNDLTDLSLSYCAADRDVLVALYRATGGASWETKTNWLSDEPLSTWHGLNTDSSGRVTGLSLDNNQLSGAIPSALGNLTNLTTLYLDNNQLSGAIPSALGNLTNLTTLYLSSNQLTGAIPSELGKLTNLTNLRLSGGNELTGCIPLVLQNVASNDLADLGLPVCERDVLVALYRATGGASWVTKTNWLSDEPLSAWYGVKTDGSGRVISLNLSSNQLRGSIPSDLGYLSNLAVLVLSGNQLSGAIPSELGKLTNLIALSLHSNGLTGAIPSDLGKLTKLTELHLSGNKLSGCIPLILQNVASNDLANLDLPVCDRDVLGALYRATGGASWGNKTNWLSDKPLSTWYGVKTDGSGRVIELALNSNRLTGSIPSDLGKLSNLAVLVLSNNQLSGAIPSDLGNLTNLTKLFLFGNKLNEAIPSGLGDLTNLTTLTLGSNRLKGTIPSGLGKLINLKYLTLDNNKLTGAIPSDLGKLTNLIYLHLSGNQLSGCIPLVLQNVETNDLADLGLPVCDRDVLVALYRATGGASWGTKTNWLSAEPINRWHGVTTDPSGRVTKLILNNNRLSGSIPSALGHLTNLTALSVYSNTLSGAIPSELGKLTNLTVLNLHSNKLTGAIPSDLGKLTNLIYLYLSRNQLSGCIPLVLRNVASNDLANLGLPVCDRDVLVALYRATGGASWGTKTNWLSDEPINRWHGVTTDPSGRVTKLILSVNRLTGSIPSDLGYLTNLTRLVLSGNNLSGSIPSALGNLTNLTRLVLSFNQLSGSIPSALGNLTNLTELYLAGGNKLSGCIPPVLRNVASNDLASLKLPYCSAQ